jgi:hypothetical protein
MEDRRHGISVVEPEPKLFAGSENHMEYCSKVSEKIIMSLVTVNFAL